MIWGGRGHPLYLKFILGIWNDIVPIMPRKSRIDAPCALHHVIVRGIERGKIFKDDEDRDSFLERLGTILKESDTRCFAWALIPNHFICWFKPVKCRLPQSCDGYWQDMPFIITGATGVRVTFFRTDTSPFYARKMFICWNWSGTFTWIHFEPNLFRI